MDDLEAAAAIRLPKRHRSDTWYPSGPTTIDESMDWYTYNRQSIEFHEQAHGVPYLENLQKNTACGNTMARQALTYSMPKRKCTNTQIQTQTQTQSQKQTQTQTQTPLA